MRDSDAFDGAYGRLGDTRLADDLRSRPRVAASLPAEPAERAGVPPRPRSRLLARLDVMAPKPRSIRRNWRFTD